MLRWETNTISPFGSLIEVFKIFVIEVNISYEWIMWFVALVFMVQLLVDIEGIIIHEEVLEWNDIPKLDMGLKMTLAA